MDQPMSWVAAKDRFFVQILAPQEESAGCELTAWRDTAVSNAVAIGSVSARMLFPEKVLKPGETAARTLSYYAGPKKHALLRRLGGRQDDVMEFGFFAPVCKPLLWCLNYLYRLIPNYGVAVILLTALVRLLFWPVTHKSTESMKKMQSLQPQVAQIREKFKDKPQKMNQEIMALYRENKVNPMSGCLPVLVQIPVFIALYTVLRSAIELRFAPFLWVHDLSEPEGLLAGKLPFVSALNILPLFMTATMVWQQKLTPTAGDPQQQKMMVMMPVVMLFIFYSMPSALVLYWSVSQCLSIVQLLMQRRTSAARAAPSRP
jgi:YidC/Oxa1 family membrane protein insertase